MLDYEIAVDIVSKSKDGSITSIHVDPDGTVTKTIQNED